MLTVDKALFFARYLKTQEGDFQSLTEQLQAVRVAYPALTHFVMYECAMLDSSRAGQCIIMPIGPQNTFTSVDMLPKTWSPRGLASDMSVPILLMPVSELEDSAIRLLESELDGKKVAYTNQTEFLIQTAKGSKSAYKTKYKVIGSLSQAVLLFNGINCGRDWKKRIFCPTMNKPVLAVQRN